MGCQDEQYNYQSNEYNNEHILIMNIRIENVNNNEYIQ